MKKHWILIGLGLITAGCGGQFNDPPKKVIQSEEPFQARLPPPEEKIISISTGNPVELEEESQ